MKKILFSLMTAAAVLASCAKAEVIEQPKEQPVTPVTPVNTETALFCGTIEQPGGTTKATVDTDGRSILWSKGDSILVIPKRTTGDDISPQIFVADRDGATAYFGTAGSVADAQKWLAANDSAGYTATFYPNGQVLDDCSYPNVQSLARMPLDGTVEVQQGGTREITFKSNYAILEFTVPGALDFDKLVVVSADTVVRATVSDISGAGDKIFYVPVKPGAHQFSFKAKKGSNDAGVMDTYAAVTVAANTVYPISYFNTICISARGEYTLSQNGLDYKVNFKEGVTDQSITINAADATKYPANITIDARNYNIKNLIVNAPYSHVEVINGSAVDASSITSKNTLDIKPSFSITGTLTVNAGSVIVEGTNGGAANVATINVPSDAASDINITINTVTSGSGVVINNQSSSGNVTVVGDKGTDYTTTGNGVTEVTPVAKIGDFRYGTLESAVAAAKDGETVTLTANADMKERAEVIEKEITIDLNGKNVTYSGESVASGIIFVHNGAGLTINGSGSITSGDNAYAVISMTKKGDNASAPAKLTVNGGTLTGTYYAITGNGSRHNTSIIINGGVFTATKSEDNLAIYHPQEGTITVNGGNFTGYSSAIEMRAGTLTITNGAFTATAPSYSYTAKDDGSTTVGAAIAVAEHSTKKGVTVALNGGTYTAQKPLSVVGYKGDNSRIKVTKAASLNIPAPAGFVWENDTTLKPAGYVAKIGSVTYATLADAVAAVKDNETITLVTDINDATGISVDTKKTFTVDFAGHTYTANRPGAGSTGTKTQAFQLLKDQTVTFKNGTINCAAENKDYTWDSSSTSKGIAMIIQNYCNLTLEDMTIDGTNIAHNGTNVRYMVSNNSGTVEFKGATSITAPAGDVAFDACNKSGYAAPTVTWNSTGNVNGNIELSGGAFTVAKELALASPINVAKGGASSVVLNADIVAASSSMTEGDALVNVKRGGDLTISGTKSIDTKNQAKIYSAVKMTVKDDSLTGDPATLTVNSGNLIGTYYAINGNGSRHNTVITIKDGSFSATMSNDNLAVFHPQEGTLTVNGGTFTGYSSAIEMRAGTLTIAGGSFTASATNYSYTPSGSGNTTVGAAIAVAEHSTKKGVTVALNGGTYTAQKPLSVVGYDGDVSRIHVTKAASLNIAAPEGFSWKDNTTLVTTPSNVAKVGSTLYTDLAEALNAAKTEGSICELLADVDLSGVAWTPITGFSGTFDGKNHTVSNLSVSGDGYDGLFASIYAGTVKDLTIDKATITSTGGYVGVLAGSSGHDGSKELYTKITNVKVKNSTLSASSGEYVGALFGHGHADVDSCTVSKCDISGNEQVGGAIGYMYSSYIKGCTVNETSVTAVSRAGGLIGKINIDEDNVGPGTIRVNENKLTSVTVTASNGAAAGLLGQFFGNNLQYEVKNNTVNAKVSGNPRGDIYTLRGGSSSTQEFLDSMSTKVTGNTFTEML